MSLAGPWLPTYALRQVGSHLRYTGHQINIVVTPARGPMRSIQNDPAMRFRGQINPGVMMLLASWLLELRLKCSLAHAARHHFTKPIQSTRRAEPRHSNIASRHQVTGWRGRWCGRSHRGHGPKNSARPRDLQCGPTCEGYFARRYTSSNFWAVAVCALDPMSFNSSPERSTATFPSNPSRFGKRVPSM
jgi:hypothetical protein